MSLPSKLLIPALVLCAGASCKSGPADPEEALAERTQDLKERIADEIEDPARADALYSALDRLNAAFREQSVVIRDKQHELREAARQYGATDEELQTILTDLRTETLAIRMVLEDGHFELRGSVTEEEWKAIVGDHKGIF